MSEASPEQKIISLTQQLNRYSYLYYQENTSEISDYQFDQLLKELEQLEGQYPEYQQPDSPTQRVGGTVTKKFETVKHRFPMLSLGNTYSKDELMDFHQRVIKGLGREDIEYICELKFDGLAISLLYEDGLLRRAVTRGDGVQGDDITTNAKTIKSIPLRVMSESYPSSFEVRGEVYLPLQEFERLNLEIAEENKQRVSEGSKPKPLLANPRNTASGTMKMQDSSVVAQRNMDCFLYALSTEDENIETHQAGLEWMRKMGFNVSDASKKCRSLEEVFDYIDYWETKRMDLPVDTDGIVIKVNQTSFQNELGTTAKSPRWAISYKYKSESAPTRLNSITYQVGRTGAITPVANLTPVQLAGTTVKRASLHNANEIARLDIHENDMVWVEKGGEIIPKITAVDVKQRDRDAKAIQYITECPECQTSLIRKEGEANHYCPNETGCPPQIMGRIEHFISRNAMDVASLGPETIKAFFENGLIKTVADLYELSFEDIDGFEYQVNEGDDVKKRSIREKGAKNIIKSINDSKEVSFSRVLFALGIRYVGKTVAEKLSEHFKSMDQLKKASFEELIEVPEIGDRIAESVREYFGQQDSQELVSRLAKHGLQMMTLEDENQVTSDVLQGQSFVVSGVFSLFDRDQLKTSIKNHGGRVASSVSGKTDYLIAGDNMGPSKLAKAEKLDVRIIDEHAYLKMIEGQ